MGRHGESTTEHHTRQTHTFNLLQQDITRKMSWVMVMGLFDLMAESGPGDENIDEIALDKDEKRDQDGAYNIVFLGPSGSGKSTLMNNMFNETVFQTGQSENSGKISKKQNKQYNHNPVHLGRNEVQVENQYHQHQYGFRGSIVHFEEFLDQEEEEVAKQDNNPVKKLDFEQANSCFFDQEEEKVAEPDNIFSFVTNGRKCRHQST